MSKANGLEIAMPGVFPSEALVEFKDAGIKLLKKASEEHWIEFCAGCENISWRFRAGWDHAESYKSCYKKMGPMEAVYETEKHYFGTYINVLSAIESLLYSVHALLASSELLGWPFSETERRMALPGAIIKKLDSNHRQKLAIQDIYNALVALNKSEYWAECKERRHRMYHRSRIPRHVAFGGGPPRFWLPAMSNTKEDQADLPSIEGIAYSGECEHRYRFIVNA